MPNEHHIMREFFDTIVRYMPLLNAVLLAILAWMSAQFKSIRTKQDTANEHLAKINGSIQEELTWRRSHVEFCEAVREQCRELQKERISAVARELDALRRKMED